MYKYPLLPKHLENMQLRVLKRNNRGYESVKFDKITSRLARLCVDLSHVNPTEIALITIKYMYDRMSTVTIDDISASAAHDFAVIHPQYDVLAGRILISNLHKSTPDNFSDCVKLLNKQSTGYKFVLENAAVLDAMIEDSRDYNIDYFSFRTLSGGYFKTLKEPMKDENGAQMYVDADNNDRIPEFIDDVPMYEGARLHVKYRQIITDRPQYLFMRVAIAVSNWDLVRIKLNYDYLSCLLFTHATPTLFNALELLQQLNSCFLLGTADSIEEINHTISNCGLISKQAGGIGVHMSNVRCAGQYIAGTDGYSTGIIPQLRQYNASACCWNQGGKRPGSYAIYIEPWHGDILAFLRIGFKSGSENLRARDLFFGLWVPDLIVHRARAGLKWSLFSADTAPGLCNIYDGMEICEYCDYCANPEYEAASNILNKGKITNDSSNCTHKFVRRNVFTELYMHYEKSGLAVGTVLATTIVDAICASQRECGMPYICWKDTVNRMSNQSGIGTIKSSNLCTEIMEYSSSTSYACCTLSSICLKRFMILDLGQYTFDHKMLHEIVETIVENLDNVINVNNYPVKECEANSHDYRPIGIGIQGLAEVFMMMRVPFLSDAAAKLDLEIFETIYHAALTASIRLAKTRGSFTTFERSPAAMGKLAQDLFAENRQYKGLPPIVVESTRYNWDILRTEIKCGMRNSLLISPMPTVSTSQIMGNTESFEPYSANIYTKSTKTSKITLSNRHMIEHLIELELWNDELRAFITNNAGSIQGTNVPAYIKEIYLTVWEIPQTRLMERAAKRQAFIDQSQSLNIHLRDNSDAVLRGVFHRGFDLGLKTNNYYIRTRAAVAPMQGKIATKMSAPIIAASTVNTCSIVDTSEQVCIMEEGCTFCSG